MKEHILSEIKRLADAAGAPPGQALFTTETGITAGRWRGVFWARWSDALLEAGCQPNAKKERFATEDVLAKIADACRHYQRFPTSAELKLYHRKHPTFPSLATIANHFPKRTQLVCALLKFIQERTEFRDVAPLLPKHYQGEDGSAKTGPEGSVYLLKSGDYYKVGRSDHIERRVKQITISLPESVSLVHTIRTDDPAGIEAYWHRRFAGMRANGEWFKLGADELRAFLRRRYQ